MNRRGLITIHLSIKIGVRGQGGVCYSLWVRGHNFQAAKITPHMLVIFAHKRNMPVEENSHHFFVSYGCNLPQRVIEMTFDHLRYAGADFLDVF